MRNLVYIEEKVFYMLINIEKLFFSPDNVQYGGHPKKYNFPYKEVYIEAADSRIHGFFVSPKEKNAKATVIYFHGRGSNLSDHWKFVDWIPASNLNLFIFDYRGYGRSSNYPTLSGVLKDCVLSIKYVNNHLDDTGQLILLGQSLGGAFCLCAANEYRLSSVKAMIIDSTFDTFNGIAASKVPFLPRQFLSPFFDSSIHCKLSPIKSAFELKEVPKLFIHGTKDKVIPYRRGRNLYKHASQPKKLLSVEADYHLSTFRERNDEQMSYVITFINQSLD